MLELRPCCECCATDLPGESTAAFICSFECTYCADCAQHTLHGRCPNCSGELVRRPARTRAALTRHPATTVRIVKESECKA